MKFLFMRTIVIAWLLSHYNQLLSYGLPIELNLGFTNILDGGPKHSAPGFYWIQYNINYHAKKYLDGCGNLVGDVKSPVLNIVATWTELLYQSNLKIFGGAPGLSFIPLPIAFFYTSSNNINITSTDVGIGNPVVSPFFQWDTLYYKGRPLFVHRLGLYIFLPCGTNKYPEKTVNPADILTCADFYWAASLYWTEHCATSWRLFYTLVGKNKKTNINAGTAYHMNFSTEYEVYNNYWLAINGYYLQQLHNNKQCGVEIPNSKERVVAAGPGFLFFLPRGFQIIGHLYFETKALNRTQGVSALLDLIKYF